jgi:hypothetical protein
MSQQKLDLDDFAAEPSCAAHRDAHNTRTINGLMLTVSDLALRLAESEDTIATLRQQLARSYRTIADQNAELYSEEDLDQ